MTSSCLRTSLLASAVAAGGLLCAGRAAAEFRTGPYTSRVGGQIFIGTRLSDGLSWAAFQPWDGAACKWYRIGYARNGGLYEYVNVIATTKYDSISFPDGEGGPNQLCGESWGPVVTNGYPIEVSGDDGGDTILNTAIPGVFMTGNRGNDVLLNWTSTDETTPLWGESGNDVFYIDNGDYALGGDGDDIFCMGGRASLINGGAGYDKMCGNTADSVSGIKERNCTCS